MRARPTAPRPSRRSASCTIFASSVVAGIAGRKAVRFDRVRDGVQFLGGKPSAASRSRASPADRREALERRGSFFGRLTRSCR
jgi:hypothetical protein